MSESLSSRQSELLSQLENKFSELNQLLYPTNVPCEDLENKFFPYVAEDVVFQDPWTVIRGKSKYNIAMKGYHNMLNVTIDTHQVSVQFDATKNIGRCMVDATMNLQMAYYFIYPLRNIVVYDFRMLDANHLDGPRFEIFHHQEIWSYMEMIQGLPVIGWIYKNLIRPALGQLFVGASYISCVSSEFFKGKKKIEEEKRKQ